MDFPEARYARSGDLGIAYQVLGSGSLDLVFIQGYVSNLDLCWEEPGWAYFLSHLAGFSRLSKTLTIVDKIRRQVHPRARRRPSPEAYGHAGALR